MLSPNNVHAFLANKFIEEQVRQVIRETIKDLMEAKRTQLQIPISDKLGGAILYKGFRKLVSFLM